MLYWGGGGGWGVAQKTKYSLLYRGGGSRKTGLKFGPKTEYHIFCLKTKFVHSSLPLCCSEIATLDYDRVGAKWYGERTHTGSRHPAPTRS